MRRLDLATRRIRRPTPEQGESAVAWLVVALSSDLDEGSVRGVKAKDFNIAIYRIDGKVFATSNVCTHGLAMLSDGFVDGDCIECPLHQGLFHIPTGEVRSPPLSEAIAVYSAKEEGDNILVDLPD
jgi:nitrite reductase/ring-hydroxylating ferredoxin subunit